MVPADDKENARLIISQIDSRHAGIVEDELSRNQPARRKELLAIRKSLAK